MAKRQKKEPKNEFESLLERAQAGDRSTLPAIREMFDQQPELWEANGDLARIAEDKLIDTAIGDDLFFKEALRRRVDRLKGELVGSKSSPLERLLADRIAACWLQVHYWESIYSQALGSKIFLGKRANTTSADWIRFSADTWRQSSHWPRCVGYWGSRCRSISRISRLMWPVEVVYRGKLSAPRRPMLGFA